MTQEYIDPMFAIAPVLIVAIFLLFVFIMVEPRKTKRYREDLANLYVAGKLRQYAKQEGIDFKDEIKEFMKFERLNKVSYKEFDEVLEEELNQKLSDDFDKVRDKASQDKTKKE